MAEVIKIIEGYENGTLNLSGKTNAKANKGQSIKWKIKGKSNVTSILDIQMKDSTTNIFSTLPHEHNDDSTKWKAEIDEEADDYAECEYSIIWDGKWGRKEYDTKITVMPSSFSPFKLLIVIVTILLGIFSLQFLFKKINRK